MNDARPPIFDEVCRTDPSPAGHQETSFQFLNRVQGSYWDQVRELVQEWFEHVANDVDYRQLRGNFRANNAANHSAFLELYVHESLRRAGYRVVIHPDVPNTTRCPDFLVEGFGDKFYVEATMPGTSDASQGPARRRADFLDTIQGTKNQDFFLSLDHLVVGPNPAKGRRARAAIEQWLAGLDIDNVSYRGEGRARFSWALDGWEVEFSAIPIPVENRGNPNHRIIGVYADGKGSYPDDVSIIRAALGTKTNAYGALEHPLIIALGTYIWGGERSDTTDALYGSSAVIWDETVQETRVGRLGDGFFGTADRPANQSVAAVLHINQLQPYHLQRAQVTLWPHPAVEVDSVVDRLAGRIPAIVMRASDGRVESTPSGIEPGVFFGLPDPWPTGEAFPMH